MLDRLRDVETVIRIDHQLDLGADRLPHGRHAVQILAHRAEPDLHLDRLEALLHVSGRLLDRLFVQPVHVLEVEAGGVRRDRVAEGAPDQFVQGLLARLSDDVPQGDVDPADARDGHAGEAVILHLVVQSLPDDLDVEGVLADDRRSQERVHDALGHRRGPIAIPPAGDALVGPHLDNQRGLGLVIPAAGGGEGFVHVHLKLVGNHVDYFHETSLPVLARRQSTRSIFTLISVLLNF